MMPFVGLVGVAGWLVWREVGRAILPRRPPASRARQEATSLELDPKTGVYRPADRDRQ